ncbi:MAG: winged helix-turn-helix domain-containing protein [Acidobacteriia bacterium]|nr:winged helix-turn-helix domain-containing protein [Terriglobia bacterium]
MAASLIRFGLYELNTGSRQLYKQGRRVRLQEQPLRVLEVLLEQPGELVTRDELKRRLWPGDIHVDFESGLNGAIKRLRLALGDSGDNPRFIETVPKCGYRFLAPVQSVNVQTEPAGLPARSDLPASAGVVPANRAMSPAVADAPPQPAASRSTESRARYWIFAASLAMVIAVAGYLLRPAPAWPHITRIVKLSSAGRAWSQESLMSDGARLYYTELDSRAGFQLRQILLNGNEDTLVAGLPPNSLIKGLSPDHTLFLGLSRAAAESGVPSPYWVVPVVGGPPRRLGNFLANDISWSPDGRSLAFGRDKQLLTAGAEGTEEREMATLPGWVFYPRWSPDGRRLRCTVVDAKGQLTIWEVSAEGRNLHQLQFNWPGNPMEGFGEWTPDGRHYVFVSRREGISNLWMVPDHPDWLHFGPTEPVQLTAGPISYYRPLPSRDGTQIFALGKQPAGDLLRYDEARRDFVPYLGGRSADHLDFNRDGSWVAYVAYPEGTLWRARSDGSQQLQLTFPPQRASTPRWSPDGKRIAFVSRRSGELPKLYTISPDGGNPEPLIADLHAQTAPSWSPQGDSIVYGRDPDGENQDIALYQADLRSGRAEKLPGTDGLYGPRWSPDGRSLAAQSTAGDRLLVLVDLRTGKRTTLTRRKADYPAWSADSQYLYFNTMMTGKPALFRVHVPDGREEKIIDVHFPATGVYGAWSGLSPDGSPLVLRDREQADVYVLSLALR